MAVPFINEDDESEEQIQRLHQLFAEFVQVLTQILEQLQQAPPPMPAQYNRLASCGDAEDDEDDEEEEPPGAAAMPVPVEAGALPDVVPRPAPRLSLAAPRPAPRSQAKWPARSPFTKYITAANPAPTTMASTAAPRVPVAVSRTTCCFNLPDVVRDAVDPAPSAAPGAAPMAAAPMAAAKTAPSPAPRRCHPTEASGPRPTASRRRSSATLLAAELAASVAKYAAASPAAPAWLRDREDDLEKLMKPAAAVATRSDHWVSIGNNLRELADRFEQQQTSVDAVDGPAAPPPRTSLLRMLLPLATKGSLEFKFITTAIVLYCGYNYFCR